ncbi:MAG: type III pantothenate kinase [Planctomycetaceae bacterium]
MKPALGTFGDTVLVADVGNSRIKLAAVESWGGEGRLPTLGHRQELSSREFHPANLERWLAQVASGSTLLVVGSVHDAAAARLEAAVAAVAATTPRILRQRRVTHGDLPLTVRLDEPQRVGIDRLASATAASTVRPSGSAAIVVDCGTAATVGCIDSDGAFVGGAILAGPALLARALAEGTSRLPEVAILGSAPPPPMPGRSTAEAIAAGIGWGIRGAIRELVDRAREALGGTAGIYLTGGWRGAIRDVLPGAVEEPDLVLAGLALAANRAARS